MTKQAASLCYVDAAYCRPAGVNYCTECMYYSAVIVTMQRNTLIVLMYTSDGGNGDNTPGGNGDKTPGERGILGLVFEE